MIHIKEQSHECVVISYTHREEVADVLALLLKTLKEQQIYTPVRLIYSPPHMRPIGYLGACR